MQWVDEIQIEEEEEDEQEEDESEEEDDDDDPDEDDDSDQGNDSGTEEAEHPVIEIKIADLKKFISERNNSNAAKSISLVNPP